jgi:heme exporter protein D
MFDSIQFSSMTEFLEMGGYAFNVWTVYALFVVFFLINIYHPLLRKKQILKEQKRRLQRNIDDTLK